jgi:ferredoxin
VGVLAGALVFATYLTVVQRSRRGLVLLTVFSLCWFGLWRKGCICPIGAIQNVALAAADPSYVIPFTAVAFFVLPILVTLYFGRTFCASVCPLGAVQELAALWPIRVPGWLDQALGLLPFIYLGAAVLFAATGTTFLICSYDPFVAFFRLSGPVNMLILGACFLVVGLFVGRPYCRYLCPYGAILGLCSRLSGRHLRIPPEECIRCRLCEDACPYGAIREPIGDLAPEVRIRGRRRLGVMLLLLPLLIGVGFLLGLGLAFPLARLHPTVRLAEYVHQAEQNSSETTENPPEVLKPRYDAVEAFRNTGRPVPELHAEALQLRQRFRWLGGVLGAWTGLVLGLQLISLALRRRRADYEPDRANCVSCGRCFWYCPPEQVRQGLIETLPVVPETPAREARN